MFSNHWGFQATRDALSFRSRDSNRFRFKVSHLDHISRGADGFRFPILKTKYDSPRIEPYRRVNLPWGDSELLHEPYVLFEGTFPTFYPNWK